MRTTWFGSRRAIPTRYLWVLARVRGSVEACGTRLPDREALQREDRPRFLLLANGKVREMLRGCNFSTRGARRARKEAGFDHRPRKRACLQCWNGGGDGAAIPETEAPESQDGLGSSECTSCRRDPVSGRVSSACIRPHSSRAR